MSQSNVVMLSEPEAAEGADVYRLVAECKPLDTNSMYCNLLQCSHFSATSVAARRNGQLAGFISAYIIPGRSDTLFIWQVAVAPEARGEGLASRMIQHILDREVCRDVHYIETTITPDNSASMALFRSLASGLEAGVSESVGFDRDLHFDGQHDTEMLFRIGPF